MLYLHIAGAEVLSEVIPRSQVETLALMDVVVWSLMSVICEYPFITVSRLCHLLMAVRSSARSSVSLVDPLSVEGAFVLPKNASDAQRSLLCALRFGSLRPEVEGQQYATWRYTLDLLFATYNYPFPQPENSHYSVGSNYLISQTHFQFPASALLSSWADRDDFEQIARDMNQVCALFICNESRRLILLCMISATIGRTVDSQTILCSDSGFDAYAIYDEDFRMDS